MKDEEFIRRKVDDLRMLVRSAEFELNAALDKLGSAGRWGMWDIFGGGLIAGLVKHSRIDDALSHLNQAKPVLTRLRAELSEMELDLRQSATIGGFAIFADFVFDGLFSDLYMQSKIGRLKEDVGRTLEELDLVDRKLQQLGNE